MKSFARHIVLLAAVSLTLGACSSVPLDEEKGAPIDNRSATSTGTSNSAPAAEPAARSAVAPVQATSSTVTGLPAALSDPSSPVFRKVV